MTKVTFTVPAIHCAHCTRTIESEVGELAGVKSVKADPQSKKVDVVFEAPAEKDAILARLAEIDFPAQEPSAS
jgi:copper chaperone